MRQIVVGAVVLNIACCAAAMAQTDPTGTWSATWTDSTGKARDAELVIAGDKGTFRIFAQGRGAKNNPCLGRDLPVAVQPSGNDLTLVVSASQAMRGCEDFTVALKRVDDNTFDGTTTDSGKLRITRK